MLQYIRTTYCPHCGCTSIAQESVKMAAPEYLIPLEHCLGGRWETRVFGCGHTVSYEPCFDREQVDTPERCRFSPLAVARATDCAAVIAMMETRKFKKIPADLRDTLIRATKSYYRQY